jgi:hypothetical protein
MQATMTAPAKPQAGEEQRALLWVILTVAVGLLLGLALKTSVEGRSSSFNAPDGAFTLSYPSGWVMGKGDEGNPLAVSDSTSPTGFVSTLTVRTRSLPQGQTLNDAATSWTLSQGKALREFSGLGSQATTLAGQPAIRLDYAYIATPRAGVGLVAIPVVVKASDTLVVSGNSVLIFGAAADANHYDTYAPRFKAILSSVKLAAK